MADTGALGGAAKVLKFAIMLIFKLTASLAVELLKFGALSFILLALLVSFIGIFVYAIRWSYISSDGNALYTLFVTMVMVLLFSLAFALIQYLVKDVLKLTNMTLVEVALMWLNAAKGNKKKENPTGDQSCNSTIDSETITERKDL